MSSKQDPSKDPRLLAGVQFLRNTGATEFQIGFAAEDVMKTDNRLDRLEDEWWVLFDTESGNLIEMTRDRHRAGELWKQSRLLDSLLLVPDIDCEGDCCPANQCRYGFEGGPSAYSPD